MKIKANFTEFLVEVTAWDLTWDIGAYDTRQEAEDAIKADKADYEGSGNRSAYCYSYKINERLAV